MGSLVNSVSLANAIHTTMAHPSFNPQARWDRHVPETESAPQSELLDENIEVRALFKNGKIYPQEFSWHNKLYLITRITYHWQERAGAAVMHYFSTACGDDLYQISFNNSSLGWRMDKIIQ